MTDRNNFNFLLIFLILASLFLLSGCESIDSGPKNKVNRLPQNRPADWEKGFKGIPL